jgi:histone H3/H4
MRRAPRGRLTARAVLQEHFGAQPVDDLVTAARTFPVTMRVDVQLALERQFRDVYPTEVRGLHSDYDHETLGIARVVADGHVPVVVGPTAYDEIDVGEAMPARCLSRGMWLARAGKTPFVVIVSAAKRYGETSGVHVEIAVPKDETGDHLSHEFLDQVEALVKRTGSYRGKVLSLETSGHYSGQAGSVKVHRLPTVTREDIILPEPTLRLLERNVHGFIRQRNRLHELGLPVKKGLLFCGPPGTGKTHTINYLASQLPDHTTLLITSEQVAVLDEYFQLARFLQPAMVVIEDVDLIARSRESMRGPCEETLLNKLLNEMDGLREDAELLFVLTTNRPDQLEAALASRPGRIDQVIEFPLPDADGRRRLVKLYARDLRVPDDVVATVVARTQGASAAFIKELMRRSAQFCLEAGRDGTLGEKDLAAALDEMLFSGGTLNVKLLGGSASGRATPSS